MAHLISLTKQIAVTLVSLIQTQAKNQILSMNNNLSATLEGLDKNHVVVTQIAANLGIIQLLLQIVTQVINRMMNSSNKFNMISKRLTRIQRKSSQS